MVDIEKLRGSLAKAKSKSDHPEDVASARYQLKEWSMSAALPTLLDELERKTKALEVIAGSMFKNDLPQREMQNVAKAALKGTPNVHDM